MNDRSKSYLLFDIMSYIIYSQYQTTRGSVGLMSLLELGSFSANMPYDPLLFSEVGKRGA